jgi:hypothetical protein
MSIDKLFLIGIGLFLGILAIQQVYIRYRIPKISQQTGQELSKAAETRLTPKETFRFGLFHILFQLYVITGSLYNIWVGKFSVLLGLAFIVVALVFIRKPIKLVRDNRPVHAEFSLVVPQLDRIRSSVTPEFIAEILSEDSVINIIKTDLEKTRQIGYKEQWRLGLLTPDIDTYDLSYNLLSRRERLSKFPDPVTMRNLADEIPIKRAAILNPTTYFRVQPNRIMITHGTVKPMIQQYPGWTYRLIGEAPSHGYRSIRDLKIDTDSPSARNRNRSLPRFLQEDGFPLKEYYPDGDPLTTERGGTIIVDGEDIRVIYPNYFVQRRLIDDLGNLVYLGLDENFGYSSTWNGVSVVPSISKKLYRCVTYNEYIPMVRFRSFPYASDFMLPILDTPMSESGWSDLFVDTRGKARLYIAKEKTLNEWYEMMERLRQLFFGELAKKGYHLLGLTKDEMHLHEYLSKKQRILEDYFIIQDWSLA